MLLPLPKPIANRSLGRRICRIDSDLRLIQRRFIQSRKQIARRLLAQGFRHMAPLRGQKGFGGRNWKRNNEIGVVEPASENTRVVGEEKLVWYLRKIPEPPSHAQNFVSNLRIVDKLLEERETVILDQARESLLSPALQRRWIVASRDSLVLFGAIPQGSSELMCRVAQQTFNHAALAQPQRHQESYPINSLSRRERTESTLLQFPPYNASQIIDVPQKANLNRMLLHPGYNGLGRVHKGRAHSLCTLERVVRTAISPSLDETLEPFGHL